MNEFRKLAVEVKHLADEYATLCRLEGSKKVQAAETDHARTALLSVIDEFAERAEGASDEDKP